MPSENPKAHLPAADKAALSRLGDVVVIQILFNLFCITTFVLVQMLDLVDKVGAQIWALLILPLMIWAQIFFMTRAYRQGSWSYFVLKRARFALNLQYFCTALFFAWFALLW